MFGLPLSQPTSPRPALSQRHLLEPFVCLSTHFLSLFSKEVSYEWYVPFLQLVRQWFRSIFRTSMDKSTSVHSSFIGTKLWHVRILERQKSDNLLRTLTLFPPLTPCTSPPPRRRLLLLLLFRLILPSSRPLSLSLPPVRLFIAAVNSIFPRRCRRPARCLTMSCHVFFLPVNNYVYIATSIMALL